MTTQLSNLSSELIFEIFKNRDIEDVLKLCSTDKQLNQQICKNDYL